MISAVDLLKGIGKFSGMEVLQLPNVTGYIDTDFDGKANAAIDAFKRGKTLFISMWRHRMNAVIAERSRTRCVPLN